MRLVAVVALGTTMLATGCASSFEARKLACQPILEWDDKVIWDDREFLFRYCVNGWMTLELARAYHQMLPRKPVERRRTTPPDQGQNDVPHSVSDPEQRRPEAQVRSLDFEDQEPAEPAMQEVTQPLKPPGNPSQDSLSQELETMRRELDAMDRLESERVRVSPML